MEIEIKNWLVKHGLPNIASEHMNLPLNEVDGLDSILIISLILEIEELSGKKISKETFFSISKMSINDLVKSLHNP
jgi:acyl carrier protein